MQIPKRKPGKYTGQLLDFHITEDKFSELKHELETLEKKSQPPAIKEVQRLAELGDFSENAAYQMAKGRLRAINQRILELQEFLKHVVIIRNDNMNDIVTLGREVTVEIGGEQKTYHLLGSSETNPSKGIISHNSPIGSAILNHRVGETIKIKLQNRELQCKIIFVK